MTFTIDKTKPALENDTVKLISHPLRLRVVGGRAWLGTLHPGFESPLLRLHLFSEAT
ncbi:hypothetical protein MA16_Dca008541 [Dendrobium catenatum]|uniref:Uncharacterized protein n=1 Tax=Dendrobium catenatum TaxID=906689 RepID=A0A2I0XHQ8_9ASPA|nr:hypothetical protein MA16_Dca008541 [Dendrobium catenatum]